MNGELFFPTSATRSSSNVEATYRQIFRKLVNFGALPNNTSKSVPHGVNITNDTRFKAIYGTANDPANNAYKPIPHASPTASDNIALDVDNTNVTITTGTNLASFSDVYIVLEYVKQS